jgi:glycoprotein endo-alpha-1,2-mannosidase
MTVEDHVLMPRLLDGAAAHGLKIAWHVEPWEGRDAASLRTALGFVQSTYGTHAALQRAARPGDGAGGRQLPVYYLYDQYRKPASEWATVLAPTGVRTVRGTELDGVFICLVVDRVHLEYAVAAHCDGMYVVPIRAALQPPLWLTVFALAPGA